MKIAYCWVFCAFKYNMKFQLRVKNILFGSQPNTNTNTIRVWKIMRIWIRIYLVSKNHPNRNSIQFENICRIRIQISLFGLNYSNTILFLNPVFRYFTPLKQSWILWKGSLQVNVIEKLKLVRIVGKGTPSILGRERVHPTTQSIIVPGSGQPNWACEGVVNDPIQFVVAAEIGKIHYFFAENSPFYRWFFQKHNVWGKFPNNPEGVPYHPLFNLFLWPPIQNLHEWKIQIFNIAWVLNF